MGHPQAATVEPHISKIARCGVPGVFVNCAFALHPPERAGLADLFWPQIERIRPESYVADNDYLTFVSANKSLYASVLDSVKEIASNEA